MQKIVVFFLIMALAIGCRRAPHIVDSSFYYWRTEFTLDQKEADLLDSLRCAKLYIKFFDVDKDKASGKAIPIATIRFLDSSFRRYAVIPVVYITQNSIASTPDGAMVSLADSILQKINEICSLNNMQYREVQIDCDWTASSRTKYFKLLKRLKEQINPSADLSCTIRLHQVKYRAKTGVPPVDRGMLMYYNIGQIDDPKETNSIYSPVNADRYVAYTKDYPLALDIALPIFSWGVLYRDGKPTLLLNGFTSSDFDANVYFKHTDRNWYRVDSSCFMHGFYMKERDVIRIEEINPYLCKEAAAQLAPYLRSSRSTITFFDLKPQNINRYEIADFKEIINIFP